MMPCRSYDPRDDSGPEPQYDTYHDAAAGYEEAAEIRNEAATHDLNRVRASQGLGAVPPDHFAYPRPEARTDDWAFE